MKVSGVAAGGGGRVGASVSEDPGNQPPMTLKDKLWLLLI